MAYSEDVSEVPVPVELLGEPLVVWRDSAGTVHRRHADQGAERDRVVAAEHERSLPCTRRRGDELRHTVAQLEDLRQEPRTLVAACERLRDRSVHVAAIVRLDAERLGEMLGQPCVPDRRRAHVDAATAGAEVERGTDECHLPGGRLHAHGHKANVPTLMDQADGVVAAALVRVLLADDDGAFLESLVPLIEHQPELTVVATAGNGLDAIELADELAPDAVVIDLHMPLVDGVTAVARLRKDHPSLCLIAVTGDSDRSLHQAVAEAGADAVLQKGELVDTLVERLAAVRSHSAAR